MEQKQHSRACDHENWDRGAGSAFMHVVYSCS